MYILWRFWEGKMAWEDIFQGASDMVLSTALWSFYSVHEQGVYKYGAWRCSPVRIVVVMLNWARTNYTCELSNAAHVQTIKLEDSRARLFSFWQSVFQGHKM
jgi:hypothetical protein